MVRDAIARTTGASQVPARCLAPGDQLDGGRTAFALLALPRGGDGDGACLIEPTVRCTHCGYCLSYGH